MMPTGLRALTAKIVGVSFNNCRKAQIKTMQVFEICFRNQQLGESENWETDISIQKKGDLYSFPAQYKCIEEFNAQEQVWQATCASIGKAIDFAKFIAGVSDLHPSNSSHDDEINETRLYFEYKINQ